MYNFSLKPKKVTLVKTKYRIIKTSIPSPETVKIIGGGGRFGVGLPPRQIPLAWDRAIDFNVFDGAGNKWIDFTSTIFVTNSGHSNKKIKKAIIGQVNKDLLHAYSYPTEIKNKFVKKLIDVTPDFCQKVILASSGTEVTECAVLLMRANGQLTNKNKIGVLSFLGNMHGVSSVAQTLKGNDKFINVFGFSDPNIHRLPFPFSWENKKIDWAEKFRSDIKDLVSKGLKIENLCGVLIEAHQGWGALFYPKPYLDELIKFAKINKLLITVDEIQSGFGRTGKLFAFEHYKIKPDLICLGKGLSSSLPLSAVVGRRDLIDLAELADVGHSTHSGNALACAAGLANLEEIESRNLVGESSRKGEILFGMLNEIKQKYPQHIAHINGRGLVAAVLFKKSRTGEPDGDFASRVCELAMQKGLLLVHTGRESIKLAPPLTIPDAALKEGVRVFEESVKETSRII